MTPTFSYTLLRAFDAFVVSYYGLGVMTLNKGLSVSRILVPIKRSWEAWRELHSSTFIPFSSLPGRLL